MGTIPGTATVFLRNSILFRKYQDILSKAYFLKLKNKTEVFKYNPKQYSVIYLVPFFFKATRMILYHQNKINYLFSDNFLNYLSIYLSIYIHILMKIKITYCFSARPPYQNLTFSLEIKTSN